MKNNLKLSTDNKLMTLLFVVLFAILSIVSINSLKEKDLLKSFENDITKVGMLSSSDEIDSIEKDLEETNLDLLDTELNQIELELK